MNISDQMRLIRSKNTGPEMIVRRILHRLGYRYKLYDKNLPGKPDIVFRKRKKIILVNGCFWHQHDGCKMAKLPKSNTEYWHPKLNKNRQRDELNRIKLLQNGWTILVIWECQIKLTKDLEYLLRQFLEES